MSWTITPAYKGAAVSDSDAQTYLRAVETADGQPLEPAVARAVNEFVLGCKADGIWTAIKASCILAGARTLSGALVPLVGTVPTNNNFVSGDYNRKTGLVGNASTKYLNSNRAHNADPQDHSHISVYVSAAGTGSNIQSYIGGSNATNSFTLLTRFFASGFDGFSAYNRSLAFANIGNKDSVNFIGCSRSNSTNFTGRATATNTQVNQASGAGGSANIFVFAQNDAGATANYSNARLAFYSIGEAIDLAKLDARVTTLINAFAAVIP